ncbi:hypothetical protein [Clostridium sp. Marseille-Q7071]
MNNKFLHELQEDILNEKSLYILYELVFILTFFITVENIRLFLDVFRVIISGIALIFLVLIYLKCKDSRNKKENKKIINYIIFFIVLNSACIYAFIKDLKYIL